MMNQLVSSLCAVVSPHLNNHLTLWSESADYKLVMKVYLSNLSVWTGDHHSKFKYNRLIREESMTNLMQENHHLIPLND